MSRSPKPPSPKPPPPAIAIRPVHKPDLNALADLLASSFHHSEGWLGWLYPLLRAGIYEDLSHRLRHPPQHYACLAAFRQDLDSNSNRNRNPNRNAKNTTMVGTVEIATKSQFPFGWGDPTYLYISNLAIKQSHRRQGIATALLQECDRLARGWGFPVIYLHVLEDNQAARHLYRAAGYQLDTVIGGWLGIFLGRSRRLLLRKTVKHPHA